MKLPKIVDDNLIILMALAVCLAAIGGMKYVEYKNKKKGGAALNDEPEMSKPPTLYGQPIGSGRAIIHPSPNQEEIDRVKEEKLKLKT